MISLLKERRFFTELTLNDVSERCGISTSKLSLIERGYVAARPDEKKRIAEALECCESDIFLPDSVLHRIYNTVERGGA